jgi:type 1 fimbria pilin
MARGARLYEWYCHSDLRNNQGVKTMKNRRWTAVGAIAALLMLAPALRADGVDVSITPVSGLAGSSVEVVGTVTNNTSSTVFLNGDTFSVTGPDLSLDDTDFFSNAPFSLDPSQSSGPFDIFTIDIGALATPGVISPNFFSILGGSDGGASDVIGTVMFDVTVQGTAPVPEPSELLLLLFGIAQIGVWGASLRAGQKK